MKGKRKKHEELGNYGVARKHQSSILEKKNACVVLAAESEKNKGRLPRKYAVLMCVFLHVFVLTSMGKEVILIR